MKVTRESWLQAGPLLGEALAVEPGRRESWLSGLEASQPAMAPLLRQLLRAHVKAEAARSLETTSGLRTAPEWTSGHARGERIGPFELLRPLGHGGMGEVWLARQADGRVERELAVKLPAMQQLGEGWRERFRRECDILARLEHAHIARLYDAGVAESGQPWLAMEFVDGLPLSEHVAARTHSLAQRVALFRQVLAAVAHAHRHLVVHRDLKPANILVDAAGAVKLLDFGIAKLVDADDHPAAADLTRLGGRLMTLRYAAPEQVAAGTITTATDIYSLGVILHEVLTGLSPYRAVREGRPLTDIAMLQEDPALPSRLPMSRVHARALAGDLDAIVLKALRRDPAQRYASVEAFDADLLAWLEKRPVVARAGTWRYLAARFAARRKLPLAMAAAVLATLLAGLVMVERERRMAVAEKARAERHFASVRKLANTFIFDVHGEIEHLAGSLKARQALVRTALEYLDRLAAESGEDPALAAEVAGGYRRLAEISGDSRGAHLGDPSAALRHAERAAALLEAAQAREPDNLGVLREHRIVALLLGRLQLEAGKAAGADHTAKGVEMAERVARHKDATLQDQRNLGATLAEHGGILAVVKDDHAAAARQLARAVAHLQALAAANPADTATRATLAYAYERTAVADETRGRPEDLPHAIEMMGLSVAATLTVVRDDPSRVQPAQTLVKRHNNAARIKLKAGDVAGAREEAARARALVERLVADDPQNVANATMLAGVLSMASDIEYKGGRYTPAMGLARASLAVDARLPAAERAGLIVRENAANAKHTLAASACSPGAGADAALLAEARKLLAESRDFKRELVARGIDAREAAVAIAAIDADLERCGKAITGRR